MRVGKEMALQAKKDGICNDAFSKMCKMVDVKELCELYFSGSDWSMKNDFPRLEILKKFKGNSEQYGLYTDYNDTINNVQRVALFGSSNVEINCDGFFAGILIVRHNSRAKIKVSGNAILNINILDNSFVEIEADDDSAVNVYQYSEHSDFKIKGNVEVKKGKF